MRSRGFLVVLQETTFRLHVVGDYLASGADKRSPPPPTRMSHTWSRGAIPTASPSSSWESLDEEEWFLRRVPTMKPSGRGNAPGGWLGSCLDWCQCCCIDLEARGLLARTRCCLVLTISPEAGAILVQAISVQDGIVRACSSVVLWCCCAFVSFLSGSPWDATGSV